jgi:hypothetical protein
VSLSGRKNGISRGLPTMMVKNTVKKGGVNICLLKIVIITFHQLCSDCVCYRLIILHSPPGRRGHDQMVVGFDTFFLLQTNTWFYIKCTHLSVRLSVLNVISVTGELRKRVPVC